MLGTVLSLGLGTFCRLLSFSLGLGRILSTRHHRHNGIIPSGKSHLVHSLACFNIGREHFIVFCRILLRHEGFISLSITFIFIPVGPIIVHSVAVVEVVLIVLVVLIGQVVVILIVDGFFASTGLRGIGVRRVGQCLDQ